jgi:glycosyltransferase involved in cell wall biosynthesis
LNGFRKSKESRPKTPVDTKRSPELNSLRNPMLPPSTLDPPTISVIFGTYNRFELLKKAVESVRRAVGSLSYEIVVTDGGSTDGSREWLASESDVVLVGMRSLDGAVKAFNQAWSVSRGEYIANFNDDAEYLGNALELGVEALRCPKNKDVGQVAFELNLTGLWSVEYMKHLVYANFGIGKRDVVERVCEKQGGKENYWNPIYHTYAGDCEHSCWIWKMGMRVLGLEGVRVMDLGAKDGLRERNDQIRKNKKDGELFWSRMETLGTLVFNREDDLEILEL